MQAGQALVLLATGNKGMCLGHKIRRLSTCLLADAVCPGAS